MTARAPLLVPASLASSKRCRLRPPTAYPEQASYPVGAWRCGRIGRQAREAKHRPARTAARRRARPPSSAASGELLVPIDPRKRWPRDEHHVRGDRRQAHECAATSACASVGAARSKSGAPSSLIAGPRRRPPLAGRQGPATPLDYGVSCGTWRARRPDFDDSAKPAATAVGASSRSCRLRLIAPGETPMMRLNARLKAASER